MKNIIVALDHRSYDEAMHFASELDPNLCRVKVGKSLFVRSGTRILSALHDLGLEVFLDLKFHDIPNTVAEAVVAAAEHRVWMVNVHAQGGSRMMQTALDAVNQMDDYRPLLIAVTVLTSMTEHDLIELGNRQRLEDYVDCLTQLTAKVGLDGVVCSPHEAERIKATFGDKLLTVTPGVRPAWANAHDQKRIMTPADAIRAGSDYLVIGRPITQADSPLQALKKIIDELKTVE